MDVKIVSSGQEYKLYDSALDKLPAIGELRHYYRHLLPLTAWGRAPRRLEHEYGLYWSGEYEFPKSIFGQLLPATDGARSTLMRAAAICDALEVEFPIRAFLGSNGYKYTISFYLPKQIRVPVKLLVYEEQLTIEYEGRHDICMETQECLTELRNIMFTDRTYHTWVMTENKMSVRLRNLLGADTWRTAAPRIEQCFDYIEAIVDMAGIDNTQPITVQLRVLYEHLCLQPDNKTVVQEIEDHFLTAAQPK